MTRRKSELPATIPTEVFAPERIVTFLGRHGKTVTVVLPFRRTGWNPYYREFPAELETAFSTKDGLLVWNLLTKLEVE